MIAAGTMVAYIAFGSVWGRWVQTRLWLARSGSLPWRLIDFLDDAHRRGLLRVVGGVYQFRHRLLHYHLAHLGLSEVDRSKPTPLWLWNARYNSALSARHVGRMDDAEREFDSLYRAAVSELGERRAFTLDVRLDLAIVKFVYARRTFVASDAITEFRSMLESHHRTYGTQDRKGYACWWYLVVILYMTHHFEEAVEEAARLRRQTEIGYKDNPRRVEQVRIALSSLHQRYASHLDDAD